MPPEFWCFLFWKVEASNLHVFFKGFCVFAVKVLILLEFCFPKNESTAGFQYFQAMAAFHRTANGYFWYAVED